MASADDGGEIPESPEEMNQALIAASKAGDAAQVAHLLSQRQELGVDYTKIGEDSTPLGHAACGGHYETAKLLLEAGANVLQVDDCYTTPLHAALVRDHEDLVLLLLQPSVEARCDEDGTTVLHWIAAAEGSVEHLRRVLEAGCDPTVKDEEGRLAWEWAADNGGNDCDAARLLRQAAETNN